MSWTLGAKGRGLPLLLLVLSVLGYPPSSSAWTPLAGTHTLIPSWDGHLGQFRRSLRQQPHLQQKTEYEVVQFGLARVAMVPDGEASSLGDALWTCSHITRTFLGNGCEQCSFVELGGPGLCAFDTAKRHPRVPINLHPVNRPLADVSLGLLDAVQSLLIDGGISQYGSGRPVTLLVNILRGRKGCTSSVQAIEVAKQLLSQGAVHTAALTLPANAEACAREQVVELATAAISTGFSVFWGGFDGVEVSHNIHQVFNSDTYSRRAVSLFLARGDGSSRGSSLEHPPTKLHVFVPLRAKKEAARAKLVQQVCRFLVDTAAANNLTLHVVGLTVPGNELDYPLAPNVQKILILKYALSMPTVQPWDVVVVLDASDVMNQLPAEEILAHYMQAGAPVFHVSTEVSVYPPTITPYLHLYDETNPVALSNKYINSGCLIGRALIMKKYMDDGADVLISKATNASWLPPNTLSFFLQRRSDQGILSLSYLLGNRYGVSLDYKSELFHSVCCNWDNLVLGCPWITYNQTGGVPGFLHGNGVKGKWQLDNLRHSLLGPDYIPDPDFGLLVDGAHQRYCDVCGDISKHPVDLSGLDPTQGPCKQPFKPVHLMYKPTCTARRPGSPVEVEGAVPR